MKVRTKVILIIGPVIICMLLLLYLVNKVILLGGFAQLEEWLMRQNVERALKALHVEIDNLERINHDWASYEYTSTLIGNSGENYFEPSLIDETLQTLGIDFMAFVDDSGQIIMGRGFDRTNNKATPLSGEMRRHILAGGILYRKTGKECKSGIIVLSEGPVLIASCPVFHVDNQGDACGNIIMGRFLEQKVIGQLSKITNLPIDIYSFTGKRIQDDVADKLQYAPSEKTFYVKLLNDHTIAGYVMIRDIYGGPGVILQAEMARMVYLQGQTAMVYILLIFLIAGFTFGVAVLLILEKMLLSRLAYLSDGVSAIGTGGDFSSRIVMRGNDECKTLADDINGMLAALEQSQKALRDSEERFRLLAENARDIVYRLRLVPEFVFEYISPALYSLAGYTPEEFYAHPGVIYKLMHPQEHYILDNLVSGKPLELDLKKPLTMQWLHRDGRLIWVEQSTVPIYDEHNNLVAIEGIARDITVRKELEEQLKYCSWHDSLTGLYNRAYFDMEMHRLESGRESLGLIICDVDGLKLVNDTLGHDTGDRLLQLTATLIRSSLRQGDIVARVGGDEFAVLLPNSDERIVKDIYRRIHKAIKDHNAVDPDLPLSLSIGFAVNDKKTGLRDIYKEADNNMYREKLNNKQSARNTIVRTMMKALEARDHINEGHVDRLRELVVDMAEHIGLPEDDVEKLCLLARFHDIGKVGVPDGILFKPGPLTGEEAAQMQRHCEIGHRIALSVPDLEPIAELILKHHEWWNGEGYPQGLKGEEIPLACRILAIVDAYDAMTSDRPYRRTLSREEALAELKNCAGIQFDPNLVTAFIELISKAN